MDEGELMGDSIHHLYLQLKRFRYLGRLYGKGFAEEREVPLKISFNQWKRERVGDLNLQKGLFPGNATFSF